MERVDAYYHPMTNVDEVIGKTVGRRRVPDSMRVQEQGNSVYRAQKFTVCPKGVYKFHSHEEADEWLRKHTVQRAIKAAAMVTS